MEKHGIKKRLSYIINDKKRVRRIGLLLIADAVSVLFATVGALWVRLDFSFNALFVSEFFNNALSMYPLNLVTIVMCFAFLGLYSSVWRYASADELVDLSFSLIINAAVQILFFKLLSVRVPRSYYLFYAAILGILTIGSRFLYRFLRYFRAKVKVATDGQILSNVMIIGAGASGNMLLREIETSAHIAKKVRCFIDDNPGCQGKKMRGIPIVGGRESILSAVEAYSIDEIVIAIPTASKKTISEIVEICKNTATKIQIVPGVYQLVNGEVSISKLRKVDIEDLLGREPVKTDVDKVAGYVSGKVVLVTGGGGSIGSELCRQIAAHNPKQLIILDIYENNAYDIQQELLRKYPEVNFVVLIASVRNTSRMEQIFAEYRPQIVYHAAAHKHVPLMEDSPGEAIKNNVFGTYKTAKAADKYGVERFVLVSTDKAVNPTNIMGASKRMCEMIIQMMNEESKTTYVAVRFGNVLGSNGSVIPLFRKQIAEGGPVTVTDPNIIRYFMTIPEAVSLILEAGVYAKGGEIFVLDMGEPIRILDLAENLIKLSGYRVGEDIEIKFTGLRPGEKMYEELLMSEEGLKNTANDLIHIGKPIEFNHQIFKEQLEELDAISRENPDKVKETVKKIVPTYAYPQE